MDLEGQSVQRLWRGGDRRTIYLNFAWLGNCVCVHSLWNEARAGTSQPRQGVLELGDQLGMQDECVPVSIVAAGIQRFFFGCA